MPGFVIGRIQNIFEERYALTFQHRNQSTAGRGSKRGALPLLIGNVAVTMDSGFDVKQFAVVAQKVAEGGAGQPKCFFQDRLEDRREIAGRRIDDLQHLGGRGLLLERFAYFGDQPRVLHRDHRLRREVFEQRDLPVGERPHFLSVGGDISEQRILLAQRDEQYGAGAFLLGAGARYRQIDGREVFDVDKPFAGKETSWRRSRRVFLRRSEQRGVFGRQPSGRDCGKILAFQQAKRPLCRAAECMSFPQNRVEYRREVTGRGINDLQHLGSRGLLGKGFFKLGSALGKLAFQIGDNPLRVG